MTTLAYIDPPECGCTDCLISLAVPLDRATSENIRDLLDDRLKQRIGELEIEVSFTRSVTEARLRRLWTRQHWLGEIAAPGSLRITIFDYEFRL